MKNWINYIGAFLLGMIVFYILSNERHISDSIVPAVAAESAEVDSSVKVQTNVDYLPQIVKAVKLKSTYSFAGEDLPLNNPDVRERLERELLVNSYRHASSISYIKLMSRHFPRIEAILAEEGIPDDFKYLAVAESGLRQAVSPSGAKGFWQFLSGTAKERGLVVNDDIDERYHIEKSTRAACAYLRKLHEMFGTWTLASAAYNMGPTALRRTLDNQKESSYFDLNLSEETMRYLFRIVALKELHNHAQEFGYYIDTDDLYEPWSGLKTVEITQDISSLADFAHEHGISYRELKLFNPWLISHKVSLPQGKPLQCLLPTK